MMWSLNLPLKTFSTLKERMTLIEDILSKVISFILSKDSCNLLNFSSILISVLYKTYTKGGNANKENIVSSQDIKNIIIIKSIG